MCIRISYSRTVSIWMLHGVVERVCLPARSTVTHDFVGWRFESRRLARVHERQTPTTWNLLVNHRQRVDHYHPRWKQISLSPGKMTFVARTRVQRRWPISGSSEKKLANRFARSLSISGITWKTRFRSKTMTQRPTMNKRQEKNRTKARPYTRMLLGNGAHRSAMLIATRDHQWGLRVAQLLQLASLNRLSVKRRNILLQWFVRLTGHALTR